MYWAWSCLDIAGGVGYTVADMERAGLNIVAYDLEDMLHALPALWALERLSEAMARAGQGLLAHGSRTITLPKDVLPEAVTTVRRLIGEGTESAEVIARLWDDRSSATVVLQQDPPRLVVYRTDDAALTCTVAATTVQEVTDLLDRIHQSLEALAEPQKIQLYTVFFTPDADIISHAVALACPTWEEIAPNYAAKTREQLATLMTTLHSPSGRLIIWHGPPGTGKTYAIRALMHAWKDHYTFVNISDAATFLDSPSYYYDLIAQFEHPLLIIMEDAADPLLHETRTSHSQRISTILNLTEGLIAQGRQDQFLITFNQEVRTLDPAIIRPGRCRTRIEFLPLTKEYATSWLKNHNCPVPENLPDHITLASLFAILHNASPPDPISKPIGFST